MTTIFPHINVPASLMTLLDASLRCVLLFALAGAVSWLLRNRSAALRHGVWTTAVVLALLLPVFSAVLPSWQLDVLPDVASVTTSPGKDHPSAPIVSPSSVQDAAPQFDSSTITASTRQESTIDSARRESTIDSARRESLPAASSAEEVPAVAAVETMPEKPSLATALRAVPVSTWILIVWALGAAGMFVSLLLGTIGIRRIARKSRHITDPAILSMKDRLCEDLAIRQPVLMLQSDESFVPLTWGIWWPTVLLPREAKDWTPSRLRMVLLHELAHVKRGDCLTQLLVQLARAMYWFHPLVWWAARNLRIQRERACDDLVLTAGVAGPDYADQLLQIVRSLRSGKGTPLAAVAMARKSQFESRLLSVLDEARRRGGLSRKVAWAILAVALAVAVPLAALQPVARAQHGQTTVSGKTKAPASRQLLSYVHDKPTGKMSYSDCGAAVQFERNDGSNRLIQVRLCASRYGMPQPPKENFKLYLLDEKAKVLKTFEFPYGMIKRTNDPKWYTLRIKPTVVPKVFYAAMAFNAERTKGIYVGLDTKADEKESFLYFEDAEEFRKLEGKGAWMIRAVLMGNGKAEISAKEDNETREKNKTRDSSPAQQNPCVVKTSPVALANDVDPKLKSITVTFDRPMMDGSWSWTGGGDTYPKTTGRPRYDKKRTTCTLPVKLQPGKVYWVGINSPSHRNFKTIDRVPAKRYAILFATKSADGKETPIPKDYLRQAKRINGAKDVQIPAAPEKPSRKLLDEQTRRDVANYDRMFAQWFRPESRYNLASEARKKLMVKQWIEEARSDDFKKRTRAIAALGNVKAVAAVDTLIEIAEEPMRNNRPKWMAVRALGEIGDAKAVPTLIGLVDHGNMNTRVYARASLADITGVYFGDDKDKWAQWWKEHAPKDAAAQKEQSEALSKQAWTLWQQRKLAEAETLFQQAVELDPSNMNAWNGLGWSQFNQGKPLNAKDAFEKCLALEPKHAAALNGLGWIAKGQGKTDEAIEYWKKAVEAAPSATAALNGLTQTFMEQKNYDQAVKYYKIWLKAEPNNAAAKKGLKEAQEAAKVIQAATKAAQHWLKVIDAGKYEQSWAAAATLFRKAVAKDTWTSQLQAARKPLGKVQSRKVVSSTYTTTLPGAPDGQYVILKYKTVFENKKEAVETVTPMKNEDGQWRVSGYFVQ